MDLEKLALEIVGGKRLSRKDDLSFFIDCDLEELKKGADLIRKNLSGSKVDLCTIINAKSGACGENCKFCAQSGKSRTDCQKYSFLDEKIIFKAALENHNEGVDRFSIVTAGRALDGSDFDKAIDVYKKINSQLKIKTCASMGFLTRDQFRRLKEAGVTRIHNNIETSRRNFPNICTSHTYEMKIETIKAAQTEGLDVCSGGILGLGETIEDRIDMALSLSELGIKSIPLNILNPIPGTPFENNPPLSEDEILRAVAIFRYLNPEAAIRLAGGRKALSGNGKNAFDCGASAAITGNFLTTSGSTIKKDREMLLQMGRDVIESESI